MVAQASDLVKVASRLRAMGMVILAVRSKDRRPVGSWRSLQREPQSETSYRSMVEALRLGHADRIALVCGHGGLISLDVDAAGDAPVAEGVLAALASALGLPEAYGWAGPSSSGRGWHIWLMVHDLPDDLTKLERLPREAGAFRALEVRAWKHSTTLPIRDGVVGYGGPIPDAPPVTRSWADVQAALDVVCAPVPLPSPPPPARPSLPPLAFGDRAQSWAQAALEREVEAVRRAPMGTRNDALNRAAFALGQIVAGGHLTEDAVVDRLIAAALDAGLDVSEAGPTIRSGLRAGAAHPRHPPERPDQRNGWHPDAPISELPEEFEHPTDLGNARRLVRRHGQNVRYVHTWGQWLIWDGRRWVRDETGAVHRYARETVRAIYEEAARAPDQELARRLARWAIQSESAGRLSAMVEVARSEEEVAISHRSLDTNPWLLAARNGTIDLRTGSLLPHRREDLITRMVETDYDPEATCPTWMAFLDRITAGDAELQTYLQRAVGYTLSGDTSEQCLFFAHGAGSNGKSTFFSVLAALFGDYSLKIEAESLMLKHHGNGIPNDLARLPGARLVVSSELSGGHRLNEARIKDLTGGDVMVARFLRAEFFEFTPILKLWMYGNHKPIIHGADHGIWRRIRLVPFTVTIADAEKDPHLLKKLVSELPGILAWAVRGCLDWQREGLPVPAVVREATEEYRSDMDVIGRCLDEICVTHPRAQVQASALYQAYEAWCEANGEHALSQTAFGERLNQRGIGKVRTGRGIVRIGIGLRAEREDPSPGPAQAPEPEPVVVVAPPPPPLASRPGPDAAGAPRDVPLMARHTDAIALGVAAAQAVERLRASGLPPGWQAERCTAAGGPSRLGECARLVRMDGCHGRTQCTVPRAHADPETLLAMILADLEEAHHGDTDRTV